MSSAAVVKCISCEEKDSKCYSCDYGEKLNEFSNASSSVRVVQHIQKGLTVKNNKGHLPLVFLLAILSTVISVMLLIFCLKCLREHRSHLLRRVEERINEVVNGVSTTLTVSETSDKPSSSK